MPRLLLAALLAAVSLASGATALAASPDTGSLLPTASPLDAVTGVLSPRRIPGAVSELVGRARLEQGLSAVLLDERYLQAEDESCLVVRHGPEVLYSHQPDRPVIPASTLKVVTGWAALRRFGSDHRFVTEVRAPTPPRGGSVERLWLVGGGDPLLATAEYAARFTNQPQTYTSLESLADAVRGAGVTAVADRVYGDDGLFDAARYLPTWKAAYVTENEVGPVGALVVNDNFTAWRPKDVAAADPAAHGAAVLSGLLAGRGVAIAGPGAAGAVPGGRGASVLVAKVESPPMLAVVGEMLAESDNLTAEVLLKALGRSFGAGGTWKAGLSVVHATLVEAGLPADRIVQHDGSGLERGNRATCSALLDVLLEERESAALGAGLAIAGTTGTLSQRLTDDQVKGRVRAKTGSIDNVSGLVGFAESGDGTLAFALVGNGLPRSVRAARDFADAIARVVVAYPDAPVPDELGPLAPVVRAG